MKYPIKVSEVKKCITTVVPGKWYECLKSNSGYFTTGFAYLCFREAYTSRKYLVDNYGNAYAIEELTSSFSEVPER